MLVCRVEGVQLTWFIIVCQFSCCCLPLPDLPPNHRSGSGLSIRASGQPKPPASQPSLASYFRLFLSVLLIKNLAVIKIPSKKLVKHLLEPSFEWN